MKVGAFPVILGALLGFAGCLLDFDGLSDGAASSGNGGACFDCGECGSSCKTGACPPLAKASSGYTPFRVALAPGGVIYATDPQTSSIVRIAPGLASETLAIGKKAIAIAANATHIFWSTEGEGMFRCEQPSCTKLTQLVPGGQDAVARQIIAESDTLFWVTGPDLPGAKIIQCTINDCFLKVLADGQYRAHGIAIYEEYIYWTNHVTGSGVDGAIMRAEKFGGTLTTYLGDLVGPSGIAADEEYLYWTKGEPGGQIYQCKRGEDECGPADEITAPTMPVDTPIHTPLSVAVDSERIYWTNDGDKTVMACPLIGCGTTVDGLPILVASGQDKPGGLMATAGCLYWAGNDGVFASEKPPTE